MKGKTTVRFSGGSLNNSTEEIPSKAATEEITYPIGSYYAQKDNGSVGILKVGPNGLHDGWFAYAVEVYRKQLGTNGVISYQYSANRMIGRCAAITKTGKRCQHISKDKVVFCPTHKNHCGETVDPEFII